MDDATVRKKLPRCKHGAIYWFLSFEAIAGHADVSGWKVYSSRERGDVFDNTNHSEGNYFWTQEEAQGEADRRNAKLAEQRKAQKQGRKTTARAAMQPETLARKVESEKDVERYLVNQCVTRGWVPLKYASGIQTGYPDRCLLLPGATTVWVEVKTTGEKPRPLQRLRLRQLSELGFIVSVVDSRMKVDSLIKSLEDYITTYDL